MFFYYYYYYYYHYLERLVEHYIIHSLFSQVQFSRTSVQNISPLGLSVLQILPYRLNSTSPLYLRYRSRLRHLSSPSFRLFVSKSRSGLSSIPQMLWRRRNYTTLIFVAATFKMMPMSSAPLCLPAVCDQT